MDCDWLEEELRGHAAWRQRELNWAQLRAVFAVFGLGWIIDLLDEDSGNDADTGPIWRILSLLFAAFVAVDIAAVLRYLRELLSALLALFKRRGADDAAEKVGKTLGKRLVGPLALAFLIADIYFALTDYWDEKERIDNVTRKRVRALVNEAIECEGPASVVRRAGLGEFL